MVVFSSAAPLHCFFGGALRLRVVGLLCAAILFKGFKELLVQVFKMLTDMYRLLNTLLGSGRCRRASHIGIYRWSDPLA